MRHATATKRAVWSLVGATAVVVWVAPTLSGCYASPTRDDTLRAYDDQIEVLEQWYQEELARCEGDQQREEQVRASYLELIRLTFERRLQVIREDWEEGRQRRKAANE